MPLRNFKGAIVCDRFAGREIAGNTATDWLVQRGQGALAAADIPRKHPL